MEIELTREHIHSFACLYSDVLTREETAETVVPDTMPDVQAILDADAAVFLRSKETEDGRLTVGCSLTGTILYQPEGGEGLCRLALSAPVSFSFDDPRILRDARTRIALHCTGADARLLNPRKALLRADVMIEAELYGEQDVAYATGAEAEGLHTLRAEESVGFCCAVEEKTFVVAEEFALPTSSPVISELLRWETHAVVDEVKQVAGKAILQGSVRLDILYAAQGERCPRRESFTSSFSQIMDLPGEAGALCRAELTPTACYVETLPGSYGAEAVSMELHLVAQAVCTATREISYLADAYSSRCACCVKTAQLPFAGAGRSVTLRETVRELLELPEAAGEAISCHATPGKGSLNGEVIRVPVTVTALYATARGTVASVCRRVSCELPLPMGEEGEPHWGVARCGEAYIAPTSGGLELRLPVELDVSMPKATLLTVVETAELDTDAPRPASGRPSVMVVRNVDGNLWALAKKYGSTPELIDAANPQGREIGDFLLIPKAR